VTVEPDGSFVAVVPLQPFVGQQGQRFRTIEVVQEGWTKEQIDRRPFARVPFNDPAGAPKPPATGVGNAGGGNDAETIVIAVLGAGVTLVVASAAFGRRRSAR
jgi:hypothetical protein